MFGKVYALINYYSIISLSITLSGAVHSIKNYTYIFRLCYQDKKTVTITRMESRQGKNIMSMMNIKWPKQKQNLQKQLLAKFTGKILLRLKGSLWQASMDPEY